MSQELHQWTHEAHNQALGAKLTTELYWIGRSSSLLGSGYELRSHAVLGGAVYSYRELTPVDPSPNRRKKHREAAAADIRRQAREAEQSHEQA